MSKYELIARVGFESPTLTDAYKVGKGFADSLNQEVVTNWFIKVKVNPDSVEEQTVFQDYKLDERSGKMVYCLLVGCNDDFNPTKATDIPKTGQVLMRYPWTGAKAAAEALAANRYRVKGGTGSDLMGNIWVVLYVADKEPQHGEWLTFEPLKNVMRLDDPEEKE